MSFFIGNPEGDVMNTPCSWAIGCEIRAHPEMQFCRRPAFGDFVNVDSESRFGRIRVFPGWSHSQNLRQQLIRQI
jgi:hypothetical protein